MTANTQQQRKAGRMSRDRDVIRTAQPSQDATKRYRLPRPTRIIGDYVSASLGIKSGYVTFELETGDVTYRSINFGIECNAAIAGVTVEIGGAFYVKEELISDYIGSVRLVGNGSAMWEFTAAELRKRNLFHGQNYGPAFTGFSYPGEGMYWNRNLVDAFALGTGDLSTLTFEARLEAAFDANVMDLVVRPQAVDMLRQTGFTFIAKRSNWTFTGIAQHTYTQLPVADDIKEIWIMGDGIKHIKLEVDGDLMFDMDRATYESYLISNGRDPDALGGQWLLDFHAEGDARSLAALDRKGELGRNAKIKLDVTTTLQETPVEFVVMNSGLYRKIR